MQYYFNKDKLEPNHEKKKIVFNIVHKCRPTDRTKCMFRSLKKIYYITFEKGINKNFHPIPNIRPAFPSVYNKPTQYQASCQAMHLNKTFISTDKFARPLP